MACTVKILNSSPKMPETDMFVFFFCYNCSTAKSRASRRILPRSVGTKRGRLGNLKPRFTLEISAAVSSTLTNIPYSFCGELGAMIVRTLRMNCGSTLAVMFGRAA